MVARLRAHAKSILKRACDVLVCGLFLGVRLLICDHSFAHFLEPNDQIMLFLVLRIFCFRSFFPLLEHPFVLERFSMSFTVLEHPFLF